MLRILFVCQDNACSSQMAEGFANLLGHDGVEAFSAAPMPANAIDPRTIEMMREVGCDLATQQPEALEDLPDLEFDYLIMLGGDIECPITKARMTIEWDMPDPTELDDREFRVVRGELRKRVDRLLNAPRPMLD